MRDLPAQVLVRRLFVSPDVGCHNEMGVEVTEVPDVRES